VLTSGLTALAGVWLMASPWILGFADHDPVWASVATGLVIATLAYMRAAAVRSAPALSWINVVLGVWTLSTALWLYDESAGTANAVAVGSAVVLLGFLSAVAIDAHREARRSPFG
jgi:hypothetical protein